MQQGGNPVAPDPAMGHAANFLYMLSGDRPSQTAVRAMDIALTLHADHELNASTFAARVAAATLTDVHSAAVAGIGTLKGPLHGGANAEVMKMLLDIGADAPLDRVDTVIRAKLARKEKISGFGHRVYRTEDPRTTHLRRMSKELGQKAGNTKWFDMSERIESIVTGENKLFPKVDFYSASTYYTMGIAIDLDTPIFAVSRISGWTAHVLERHWTTDHTAGDRPIARQVRESVAWALAAVGLVAVIARWTLATPAPATTVPEVLFDILPPEGVTFLTDAGGYGVSLSPEGQRLALLGQLADGSPAIWIRSWDSPELEMLEHDARCQRGRHAARLGD
jgi:hypothetical protein